MLLLAFKIELTFSSHTYSNIRDLTDQLGVLYFKHERPVECRDLSW